MRFFLSFFVGTTLLLLSTLCGAQELHLKDGTIIKGTLLSFDRGIYTFSSTTLGKVQIQESHVSTITSNTPQPTRPNNQATIQQLQTEMLGDAATMQLIQSLQNDPDVQAIINDPAIMDALKNGDFQSLENNPKLKKLMEKSQVKDIKKKYGN